VPPDLHAERPKTNGRDEQGRRRERRFARSVIRFPERRGRGRHMLAGILSELLKPSRVAYAHCDLPCGIYDPAQARIEAESGQATKEAGLAKKAQDPGQGQKLLDLIDEIGKIFWETKAA